MPLVSSAWDVFGALFVFLFGMLMALKLAKFFGVTDKRSIKIYSWHTIFCFVYAKYVIANGGDAVVYYATSLSPDMGLSFGTAGVVLLTHLFSAILGLSFFGVFLVFNTFGFIGLLAFDGSLKVATWNKSKNIRRLATLIVFLPSVSFWSSAIGKDALSFMATGLALWAALDLRRHTLLMAFSVLVMLLVRPHIAGLMVLAIASSMIVQRQVSFAQRALVGGIAIFGAALLIPFALNYSGAGTSGSAADLSNYIEQRQGYNQEGGGGIDISGMSPPMLLFTYLFRPLPFEVHSIFALAASLDNAILLFLFSWGGWEMIKQRRRYRSGFHENRIFLWIYSFSAWFILSMTTANLGISVRQKWMFAPILIFLFISIIGRPRPYIAERHSAASGQNPVEATVLVNGEQKL